MIVIYGTIFIILIFLSAFFSSSETSILSINRIRLKHSANKKNKRAIIITDILKNTDSFFSMILFGNNLVNIAAASISTMLTVKIFNFDDELTLIISTAFTTTVILFFAEIIPKTYAFRYSEKMAYTYAFPIKLLLFLLSPFVLIITKISNLFIPKNKGTDTRNKLTIEEIKYFLKTEIELFKYNPDVLKMVNEIIDITGKDIRAVMTPRPEIIAIEEHTYYEDLKKILLQKRFSKIPVYRENLDNITGILISKNIIGDLLDKDLKSVNLNDIIIKPVFVTEYSSINYVLDEFRKKKINIAIVLDEYGSTIGLLTINDIFKEILGEFDFKKKSIRSISTNTYIIDGSATVEELNRKCELDLNESKDYTTVSGLFIYEFGRLPKKNDAIRINNYLFKVEMMGENKIEELRLVINEKKKGQQK